MTVPLPSYVDWEVMRLVVAERVVSKSELEREWSVEDVWDAHLVLDAKEEAAIKASKRTQPKRGGR